MLELSGSTVEEFTMENQLAVCRRHASGLKRCDGILPQRIVYLGTSSQEIVDIVCLEGTHGRRMVHHRMLLLTFSSSLVR